MPNKDNSSLIKNLTEFGFSDKEARIYLTLLELEVATVNEIAKASGINRSSGYVILEALKNKGFVGVSNDKQVCHYVAVSPEMILTTLDNEIKQQEILRSKIQKIIPDLKALDKSNKKKPVVRVFEGKSGLKEVYLDVYSTNVKEFRVCEHFSNIVKLFPDFLNYDYRQRKGRNISLSSIAPSTEENKKVCLSISSDTLIRHTFIPEDRFKFPVDISIYGDTVAFGSTKELFGIIIKHKEIAESLKCLFDIAWEEAKKLRTNKEITYKNTLNRIKSKNKSYPQV